MKTLRLGLGVIVAALVSDCAFPGMYYVQAPYTCRRPAVTVANTAEGNACARTCNQTHEICRGNCRRPFTQYNGREVERQTQGCHDQCDDARDDCFRACPGAAPAGAPMTPGEPSGVS